MPSLFGTDVAVNPQLRNVSRSFNGKTVREYEVDIGVDVSASNGPDGAIRRVLDVIAARTTPIMVSELITGSQSSVSNGAFKVFVEGDFPEDTYDGENSETFATFLQSEIVALGQNVGQEDIDVESTVVTEASESPYFADDVEADY